MTTNKQETEGRDDVEQGLLFASLLPQTYIYMSALAAAPFHTIPYTERRRLVYRHTTNLKKHPSLQRADAVMSVSSNKTPWDVYVRSFFQFYSIPFISFHFISLTNSAPNGL